MKQLSFVDRYKDIFFHSLLSFHLQGSKNVLDVACGTYSPLRAVKKTFYSEGIDIFEPSIKKSKKLKIHDKYTIGDITKLKKFYKNKSFDTVIFLDVIEHFPKSQGKVLLKDLERIAKKKVIVMTPNGFHHQHHLEENPYQEHKSGWKVDDFKKLGYSVYGLRGYKHLRGEHATIKYKPWVLWGLLAFISEPILYFFPKQAYQLFAIKQVNEKQS